MSRLWTGLLVLVTATTAHADEAEEKAIAYLTKRGERGAELTTDINKPGKPVVGVRIVGSRRGVDDLLTNEDLQAISALKHLAALDVYNVRATDEGLKAILEMKNLTKLALSGEQLTLSVVRSLQNSKRLHVLTRAGDATGKPPQSDDQIDAFDLRSSAVPDVKLIEELLALKSVTRLSIARAQVTDEGLRAISEGGKLHCLVGITFGAKGASPKNSDEITSVQLGAYGVEAPAKLTNAGLKPLVRLKQLTNLSLGGTKVTDTGLKEIATLKNLTKLDLTGTEVTEAGVKELAVLKNLEVLYLSSAQLTDAVLRVLRENGQLHVLQQATTGTGNSPQAKSADQIVWLHLNDSKVTGNGLKELAGLKNLATLYLSGIQLTDAGLRVLRENGQLHSLDRATSADDSRPKHVAQVAKLNLSGAQVTEAGLKELTVLKNLTALNLSNTQLSAAEFKALSVLKNLTTLVLTEIKVAELDLKELAELKGLTILNLRGTKVSDDCVKGLQNALPNCKITR